MDPDRWKIVEPLFRQALQVPAEDRGRFLERACAGDSALRLELEELIRVHPITGQEVRKGTRLAHYEVVEMVGKGGMGEVWRAHDSKLSRDVAIKTLPEAFSKDPERICGLEREAKALAALNHPGIAAIYGLEECDGIRFLVLELVDGGTLADRLQSSPVPLQDALKIALQIAESVEAAHEKGIIHRDLKPANIKITPDGRVKVLDFGLAKALLSSTSNVAETMTATQPGIVMGTPAYMSPEQARGEIVGRQTDIWSFGAVFYEMLTGASAFGSKTPAESLAKVLESTPNFAVMPSAIPASVRRIVRRCLEKDPKRRLQHIGDVRIEIEEALADLAGDPDAIPARGRSQVMPGKRAWAAILAVLFAVAAVALWIWRPTPSTNDSAQLARLFIPVRGSPGYLMFGTRHLAISDDGSHIAYFIGERLWIRPLAEPHARAVSTSATALNPFFSPDGKWLGFAQNGLAKIPVDGGAIEVIVQDSERQLGATWGSDGTIVFANTQGLFVVPETGGNPRMLVEPNHSQDERVYAWPQLLPDGKSVLFTVISDNPVNGTAISLLDLPTLKITPLLKEGTSPRYVKGHLIYATAATLKSVPFDAEAREIRGEPVSLRDVEVQTSEDNGASEFVVSESGTLVFLPPRSKVLRSLIWRDRSGKEEVIPVEPRAYAYARVSPDGKRIAVEVGMSGRDIWILDLERFTLTRLVDSPAEDLLPVWSPVENRIFFASNRSGTHDIYSQSADGTTAKLEYGAPGVQMPISITADGKRLVVSEDFKDTSSLHLDGSGRMEPLFHTPFIERLARVSPNGQWIAYESDGSGELIEIFISPFPDVKEKRIPVSTNGGRYPHWSPEGNELFYTNLAGEMMSVSIQSPTFKLGPPVKLFDWQKPPADVTGMLYDIAPDGRFLMTKALEQTSETPAQISVILNWLRNEVVSRSTR